MVVLWKGQGPEIGSEKTLSLSPSFPSSFLPLTGFLLSTLVMIIFLPKPPKCWAHTHFLCSTEFGGHSGGGCLGVRKRGEYRSGGSKYSLLGQTFSPTLCQWQRLPGQCGCYWLWYEKILSLAFRPLFSCAKCVPVHFKIDLVPGSDGREYNLTLQD